MSKDATCFDSSRPAEYLFAQLGHIDRIILFLSFGKTGGGQGGGRMRRWGYICYDSICRMGVGFGSRQLFPHNRSVLGEGLVYNEVY